MARILKRKDGTTAGTSRTTRQSPASGFVELVSPSAEASTGEACCEIVLSSGRRLLVREDIGEARLARLVAILERAC